MCGIAGLVCLPRAGSHAARPCDDDRHARIVGGLCDRQTHRGPDDDGVADLGPVCLGSSRLSIIDLSPAGHMPMATRDERWWITYNGEVYNFASLREDLARHGHVFRSRSDTEVVLRAFAQWDEASLQRFVGMFAFAVYDARSETVTLARDRFGKKPLYYTVVGGHLLFASEMKALVPLVPGPRIDARRLGEWALYRTVDCGAPDTLVEGIASVPAGHVMRVVRGRIEAPRRYFAVEAGVDATEWRRLGQAKPDAVVDELESRVVESVKDRLVSDVALGTLCSGGLDSSLITAVCARHRRDVTAFNIAVDGYGRLDESPYARAVADSLGIALRVYRLTADDYRRNIVRTVYHSDLPLTHVNSVALLLVSEFARRHGVTILMSGEGADELFGGYPQRYRRQRQLHRVRRLLARAPVRLRTLLTLAGCAAMDLPVTRFYPDLLTHATRFADRYAREAIYRECLDAYAFVPAEDERSVLASMLADLSIFLPPLLRRLDRTSMAASVECRVPFLDHRLVSHVVSHPLGHRLRGGTDKWLLKAVARRHLPRALTDRPKVGFPLPMADYLAPIARPEFFHEGFCEQALGLDPRGLRATVAGWRDNVAGLFSLMTMEIWGRLFLMGQSQDEVNEALLGERVGRVLATGTAGTARV
jgi:asparagine synthase (glutamine-hydrolysing)